MRLRLPRWPLPVLVLPCLVGTALAAVGPKLPQTSIPAGAPTEVKWQIQLLYSADPVARAKATWALGDMGPKAEAAIPFLLSMAADLESIVVYNLRTIPGKQDRGKYSSPAKEAAFALAEIGTRSVEPLLKSLKEALASPKDSGNETILAARALGKLHEKRAVEPLLAALHSPYESVRWTAADALGEIADARAVDPLIALLADKNADVRASAAEALTAIKDGRGMEALFESLAGGKARKQAHEALLKMSGVKLPADPAAWRSWWAENDKKPVAVARGSRPTLPKTMPAEIQKLVGQLYATEPLARGRACADLGRLAGKAATAVPYLVEALRDPGPLDVVWKKDLRLPTTVGEEAAKALGQIGSAAVPPLIEALKSPDPFARSNAARALGATRDKRGVDALVPLLKDKEDAVASAAASALGDIKDPRAVEPLLDVVRNGPVRDRAVAALGEIGDRRAVDPLLAILDSGSADAKAAAASGLGRFREPRAVDPLLGLVRNGPAQRDAAMAVCWLGVDVKVVDALIALLGTGSDKTRTAAALGLGFCGNRKAVDPLLAALKDKDEDVQREAAIALGRLGDARAVEPLRAQAQTAKKKKARDAAEAAVQALERPGRRR